MSRFDPWVKKYVLGEKNGAFIDNKGKKVECSMGDRQKHPQVIEKFSKIGPKLVS